MIDNVTWQVLFVHLLLYPIYQIVGTLRHELSHYVFARWAGVKILEVRLLPHRYQGRFYWGRVQMELATLGRATVHTWLAPYYTCLFHFVTFAVLALSGVVQNMSNHARVAVFILLLVSPAVDIVYNLLKWARAGLGDFAEVAHLMREDS